MESVEPGLPAGDRRSLLEGVRRRDPEALSEFFERHLDGIYDLAYRLLGESAPAEDATQEVFLRVHRAAATLDPERDPGPWLRQITRNICRDLWRSSAHRLQKSSIPLDSPRGEAQPAATKNPEETTLAGERARLVQAAIAKLPHDLREVVVLHDYSGLNHLEIAEAVGVSHAAVRKRYSRAMAMLSESLKGVLE